MTTQGTRQETEGSTSMYTGTGVDWSRRIVLLMPNGGERDGGAITYGGATPGQSTTEGDITDMLVSAGYHTCFSLPGLAIFSGDGAPQTHAFCACLALGGTVRVLAFERLVDLTTFVSGWVPILDAVEESYSGA